MYCDPSKVVLSLHSILENYRPQYDSIVREWEGKDRKLNIYHGLRKTLPNDAFPSLELEPQTGDEEWYSCRVTMVTISIQFLLTIYVGTRYEEAVKYAGALASLMAQILGLPANRQFSIIGQDRYDTTTGDIIQSYVWDSEVGGVNYASTRDGAYRQAEWTWSGKILEPYGPQHFVRYEIQPGNLSAPIIIMPFEIKK